MTTPNLFGVARQLQEFCDSRKWRSCFIGGIAVQRWGQPRVTRDVDLTLLTGFAGETPFVEALLAAYSARIGDAAQFASEARVVLLRSPEGIGIDISLAALPFEELVIERASVYEFAPGTQLRTCSAEDLMVMKLFAARPIDIRDAESVAVRHAGVLDWPYIEEQLAPLAETKDDPAINRELIRIRQLAANL